MNKLTRQSEKELIEELAKRDNKAGILGCDVYSEEFQISFYKMLEKFVSEYDDMAQMEVVKKASELLEVINNS